jgi:hypothetical protein
MSKIKKIIEQNAERIIDSWTLHCTPASEQAGKFLGTLFVTDKHIYFDAQFDTSLFGLTKQALVSSIAAAGHPLLVSPEIIDSWKEKGFLQIAKKDIKEVKEEHSLLKKKVIVTLHDDSVYIFDYGMLRVKKIVQAIKQ